MVRIPAFCYLLRCFEWTRKWINWEGVTLIFWHLTLKKQKYLKLKIECFRKNLSTELTHWLFDVHFTRLAFKKLRKSASGILILGQTWIHNLLKRSINLLERQRERGKERKREAPTKKQTYHNLYHRMNFYLRVYKHLSNNISSTSFFAMHWS